MILKNKKSALAIILCTAFLMQGCWGRMAATKGVYDWNSEIKSKWGREGVFLAFVIIPVYGLTLLGDVLIFNAIEFISGKNPIAKEASSGNEKVTFNVIGTDRLEMNRYEEGKLVRTVHLDRVDPSTFVMRSEDGVERLAKFYPDRVEVTENGKVETYKYAKKQ
jgi:hypothetical protein